jgi:phytoene synthase
MTWQVQPTTWETLLLDLAQSGLSSQKYERVRFVVSHDADVLPQAYARCAAITREHSRTFFIASGLLPPDERSAVRALYAFCRITDNLVDQVTSVTERRAALELWRELALGEMDPRDVPNADPDQVQVAIAWTNARARFNVPVGYAEQLIDGVARDLEQTRYLSFDDLAAYAYGVASTVGLMAMHVIGFRSEEAVPYAVKLGVALQITNILRDVAEDWRAGRLYLPQQELADYDLTTRDIQAFAGGRAMDRRWHAFMRFQIERTRQLYAEGYPGIGLLNPSGRFAIAAASDLYRAILHDIELHRYDVFSRRAHVGAVGKVSRLPLIYLRSRRARPATHAFGA